jgi:hypothetical protein
MSSIRLHAQRRSHRKRRHEPTYQRAGQVIGPRSLYSRQNRRAGSHAWPKWSRYNQIEGRADRVGLERSIGFRRLRVSFNAISPIARTKSHFPMQENPHASVSSGYHNMQRLAPSLRLTRTGAGSRRYPILRRRWLPASAPRCLIDTGAGGFPSQFVLKPFSAVQSPMEGPQRILKQLVDAHFRQSFGFRDDRHSPVRCFTLPKVWKGLAIRHCRERRRHIAH